MEGRGTRLMVGSEVVCVQTSIRCGLEGSDAMGRSEAAYRKIWGGTRRKNVSLPQPYTVASAAAALPQACAYTNLQPSWLWIYK